MILKRSTFIFGFGIWDAYMIGPFQANNDAFISLSVADFSSSGRGFLFFV